MESNNGDNFLQIVDPINKKEITAVGNIGQGPEDFITPLISAYNSDTVEVRDLNSYKRSFFALNAATNGEKHFIQLNDSPRLPFFDNEIFIGKDTFIRYSSDLSICPFKYVIGKDTISFGKSPIEGEFDRRGNIMQGFVYYNKTRQILVFSIPIIQYIALYSNSKDNNKFSLINEINNNIEYTISDGKLKLENKTDQLVTITKDYIVCVGYDTENGEAFNSKNPFTMHTLFIRDYNGNLLGTFDIKKAIRCISGNECDNTLYLIIENPEFSLAKIDLNNIIDNQQ